jgi:hypothetical protein
MHKKQKLTNYQEFNQLHEVAEISDLNSLKKLLMCQASSLTIVPSPRKARAAKIEHFVFIILFVSTRQIFSSSIFIS